MVFPFIICVYPNNIAYPQFLYLKNEDDNVDTEGVALMTKQEETSKVPSAC